MKYMKIAAAILLAVVMVCSMANIVFAVTKAQDGAELTLVTDKGEYEADEVITATLTLKNVSEFDLGDVVLTHVVPDGFKVQDGAESSRRLDVLAVGESASLTIRYAGGASDPVPPQTGDGGILLWAVLFVASLICMAALILFGKKKGWLFMSLILCVGIVGTMVIGISAVNVAAAENTKTLTVTCSVKVAGKDVTIGAKAEYTPVEGTGGDAVMLSDYYVSPEGSDRNPGTKDAPFRTLEKARNTVRKFNKNMTGDIVIHIGAGTFELEDTFTLTANDAGSNGYRIIYEGAGKNETVISGGTEITGWTLHDAKNNIYSAKVPDGLDFRQLYVDGVKAVRARSGSVGTYDKRIAGAERIKDGKVLPELLVDGSAAAKAQADDGTVFIKASDGTFSSEWNNLTDVELHVFTAWTVNILRVKSAELKNGTYNVKIRDEEAELVFNRQHPNIDGYSHKSTREFIYYVENAYELIDEDNEWYLDGETGTVYYKAPNGVDLNKKQVTAPRLETVINVGGTLDEPVRNVTFRNMSVQYSNWLMPSERGFVDGQSMQYITRTVFAENNAGVGRAAAGILVTCAQSVIFDGDRISNMGATGIDLYFGTNHCAVMNCEIENISGNGIAVAKFAQDDKVDYHVPYNPTDKREICTGDMIVNNTVTHFGTDYESAAGIAAGYPKDILIANNTVSYGPYTGITVGFGWTKSANAMSGNRILRNEIHHVTTVLCDAGGIYTLSEQPDSKMLGNYIHDIVLPRWADYETFGIYLDEGTGGYAVNENIVERAYGINQHATGENRVYGNYVSPNGVVTSERADELKELAGVQASVDIEALLAMKESSAEAGGETELLFEEDFESFESGAFTSDKWTVGDGKESLVSIVSDGGNKYLNIVGSDGNTKVHLNKKFGVNVTTFDLLFPENLDSYQGMYNVIRRASIDYTSNINPAWWTTVRLESKTQDESGVYKEIRSGTWYTCKTMVNGHTMYMKLWEKGAEEPEEWDVIKDMNDDVNGDCMLGLEFFSYGKSVYIDNIKISAVK